MGEDAFEVDRPTLKRSQIAEEVLSLFFSFLGESAPVISLCNSEDHQPSPVGRWDSLQDRVGGRTGCVGRVQSGWWERVSEEGG